jgi:hypothetical protein
VLFYILSNGGPGILSFPDSLMYGDELNQAIRKMKDNHKFGKLAIFIDSP